MSEVFLMDNGAGYRTRLWRHRTARGWVWRDAPPGTHWVLAFDDEDGHPCDCFGLRLDGEFIDMSAKNT